MHEFPRYAAPSPAAVADLVRRNPFALVVSGGSPPVATHTPVILPGPSLDGAVLLGHMARANPQWRSFGAEVLVVFSGPHGYVSPTAYGYTPAVPTWNYAAVHVTGQVEVITDRAGTLAVVEETVRVAESWRDPPWDMTTSRTTFESLIDGVVAFRVHVRTVHSNFKLSQDMPPDVRARVRADLPREVAGLMPD
ncbi:FMN-binding negative transcriptional regulator [Actinophytocola glycyrrhizae]|uniref:FMN-binding negative transcriptional regulator n=1 Tax=Actinophytocola glycyrrhizae TaxID=2044873 RepID=A0ABV9RV81_9PSEU